MASRFSRSVTADPPLGWPSSLVCPEVLTTDRLPVPRSDVFQLVGISQGLAADNVVNTLMSGITLALLFRITAGSLSLDCFESQTSLLPV